MIWLQKWPRIHDMLTMTVQQDSACVINVNGGLWTIWFASVGVCAHGVVPHCGKQAGHTPTLANHIVQRPPLTFITHAESCWTVMVSMSWSYHIISCHIISYHILSSSAEALLTHSLNTRTALEQHSNSIQTAFKLHSNCIQTAFKQHSNSIQTPFKHHSNCIQTAFKLHSNCAFQSAVLYGRRDRHDKHDVRFDSLCCFAAPSNRQFYTAGGTDMISMTCVLIRFAALLRLPIGSFIRQEGQTW
jgi:hypothetical protein